MSKPAEVTLDYGRNSARDADRVPWRFLLLLAAIVALPIAILVIPHNYTAAIYRQLDSGMKRKQVDSELWAFRSYTSPYQGLGPGQVCVRYDLFGMQLWMIQVIYEADGTVYQPQPIFNN